MVRLTRIYTRTGDGGKTQLSDMSAVSKTDPRVEAYGDVDEANSAIGVALAAGGLPDEVAARAAKHPERDVRCRRRSVEPAPCPLAARSAAGASQSPRTTSTAWRRGVINSVIRYRT